jgi:hypothetical protein
MPKMSRRSILSICSILKLTVDPSKALDRSRKSDASLSHYLWKAVQSDQLPAATIARPAPTPNLLVVGDLRKMPAWGASGTHPADHPMGREYIQRPTAPLSTLPEMWMEGGDASAPKLGRS